ncbi:MAG: ribonuclease P protein component [Patescibacteria group bacterium]|nr:ribonuclease P protein component [Patescibacteria group bacterium]
MIPSAHKISLDKDFENIFKTGRSIYGRFLGFKVLKNSLDYSRFSIILGKKIRKSAVARHSLKRKIFNVVAKIDNKLPFSIDCVIIVLPNSKEDVKFFDIETEIIQILEKITEKKL